MKLIKKLIVLTLVLSTAILSIVGCSNTGDKSKKEEFSVGVILGESGANDQSFNQSCIEGLEKAKKELGIKGSYLEAQQDSDYASNIEIFIDKDTDLIIGVGYSTANSILDASKNYPNKQFFMIDHNYEEEGVEIPENVNCIVFDEEEAAYLVGLIAGKMSETGKVGFIGGMKIPNITRFENGYIQGVKAGNSKVKVLSQYANTFDDAAKGKSIANQMYSNGIDIIFSAAAGTGTGAIESSKERNKYAIGVDMDQNSLAPNNVISSAMKRVDVGVFDAISQVVNGEFKGGKATVYGLKEDAVGIAPTTSKNVPKEILDYVNEQSEKIIKGEVKVSK